MMPRSGEPRTEKLKSHLLRTQSLKVLPLKPEVRQYIAVHARLTARDFLLANFYPPGPFTCIFSTTSPEFPVSAVANSGSCVGPHNKADHPAGCRFPCWVLAEYKQASKHVFLFFWVCLPKLWIEIELWFEREKQNKTKQTKKTRTGRLVV